MTFYDHEFGCNFAYKMTLENSKAEIQNLSTRKYLLYLKNILYVPSRDFRQYKTIKFPGREFRYKMTRRDGTVSYLCYVLVINYWI